MREVTGCRKGRVKNQEDQRYLIIQKRFELALGKFLRLGRVSRLNVADLSHEAKVWKSTFYDHFVHVDQAIEYFQHMMRPKIEELHTEASNEQCSMEIMFYKILFFIWRNQDYYNVMIYRQNPVAILEIAEIFKWEICKSWSKFGKAKEERCFQIFAWEMSGLICYWGKSEKFDRRKIDRLVHELKKLGQNATQRLTES